MKTTRVTLLMVILIFSSLIVPVEDSRAADSISDFRVVAESSGGVILHVAYNYDSRNGDNVFMGAEALTSGGAGLSTGYRPWPIHAGSGRAYIDLSYLGSSSATSQQIRVFMYRGGEAIFASQTFSRTKTWTRQSDDISPFNFRTTSQNARDLIFQTTYTLLSSHPRPVRLGASSLKNGSISSAHGFGPSDRLSSGTDRTTSARLAYIGSSTDFSDGILLYLYEESGPIFIYTVVPRIKYWASATTDTDGDGISDANEFALGTSPSLNDTDGDGLEDGWELEGYRWDGFQFVDSNLPFLGASPRHKDVFVEVDYLVGSDHTHKMHLDSIHKAKEIYGQMPISNADGRNGITLHILQGNSISFDGDIGGVCGQRAYLSNFPDRRNRIYHWTIAGHGIGGQGEVTSNRFVFGTGNGNPTGGSMSGRDRFLSYAVFVHELGHNLGLVHEGRSGSNQSNCKANYPSLMNYAYDYAFNCSGYDLATTQIQFSGGGSPALNESALRETGNTGLAYVQGFDSDFLGCNIFRVSGGNIDWNRNGTYQSGTVAVDCDGVAPSCCRTNASGNCIGGDGLRSDQRDSNDFSTIVLNIGASIRNPQRAGCAGPTPDSGFHLWDTPELQPVCGIPSYDRLSEHPWLKVNPVFRVRPGMAIVHPAMRHFLAPALDRNFSVRFDVATEIGPDPDPAIFEAPPDRLDALPYPAVKPR